MQITEDTKISDIFEEYGDISEVMVAFGIKAVEGNTLRHVLAKRLTVKWAARFHRVPLGEFLEILNKAIASKGTESAQE